MNDEILSAAGLDADSAPMLKVLDDLLRDPRTPMAEIYAYIDFCMDAFATSPHARQARAAFTLLRNGAMSRRAQLTGEDALA
jgi:hypothetical protein